MRSVAVLLTVYNRKSKTLACLDSLAKTYESSKSTLSVSVFITDDGSTDGTSNAIKQTIYPFEVIVLEGTGELYWNGGMIHSWSYAIRHGVFDGYLLLNDDVIVRESFWGELEQADSVSYNRYGKRGIYVGATCDPITYQFTYGGFNFINRLTLKDQFIVPDGETYQSCQCAHGNIAYVSSEVVSKMGIFCDKYIHGGTDHDYSYLAHKSGFPILTLPNYAGLCENDHEEDGYAEFLKMPLNERLAYLNSPFGFNMHNTLLFQKRCFPYRYPFVWLMGYAKTLFPKTYFKIYKWFRR